MFSDGNEITLNEEQIVDDDLGEHELQNFFYQHMTPGGNKLKYEDYL